MLKINSTLSNSKVCANYSLILQRLIATEGKNINVKQSQSATNVNDVQNAKSYDSVPGPKPAPIFGYIWHVLPVVGKYYGENLHDVHIRYQKEYGDIVRLRELKFMKDILICYSPKDIETIFRNEGPWPKRDILPSIKYYREVIRPDLFQGYGGVFTSDDEEWQEARSVMNTMLMQPRVVKHYVNSFATVADDFIERVKYLSAQNELNEMPADFNKEFMKWALESVGILSLDSRFGVLESNVAQDPEKLEYIDNVVEFFAILYKLDVLPSLARYISTPLWRRYVKVMDGITNFIQKHVDLTKERLEKEGYMHKDINDMSVIEKLMKNYDKKYVFGNVLDILLGGVDTTGKSAGSIMYLLSANPDKQEILRKEINKILPNHDDVITTQKLEKMPYLRASIKEAMRMIPISVGLSRKTSKDLVLSGYHIPKGTNIVLEQMPLLWSDEHFPEAKKFKPERWLRNDKKTIDVNPWVMLPFGFGPRSCVGRRIAQLELEILTIKIIKNFKMEWHHAEPTYGLNLLFGINSPLKIRMIPIAK